MTGQEKEPPSPSASVDKSQIGIIQRFMMEPRKRPSWRAITPGQRALLQRMRREGALVSVRPWEMSTVRSLLARGLLRPRIRGRERGREGIWFLTALGVRIVPDPSEAASESDLEKDEAAGAP